MSFLSAIKGGLTKLNPVTAAAGAVGGGLAAWGANKQAKAAAANQNAMNSWKAKLDTAAYNTERMPYYKQGSKMRTWRDTLMKSVMRNPNNGLSKIFGDYGGAGNQIAYREADVAPVTNPNEVAGAPPKLKAETGGWASILGGALGGLG